MHSGRIAPLDHHLRPFTTYSSPSWVIVAEMLVASDEATAGSVIEKQERISPRSSGSSHCCSCSSFANIASSSMLPLSGAAEFITSGAMPMDRPVSSAMGA